ncbi:MATE family efflux transporter [Methylobacterium gnaphalii]|uniref:MATE family efflux transporter n=1 Tax=Methylobacterium gnaphalii TaxID=1010610 RepID=A0A512JFL6_9HYPH|nr:MATE family efflux transporter [Methylobacterium gnaphalii]GEP08733.1 MATE family efflux transporter [Methylobacterium gnaphalii]GJD69323.1 DNA damage-inducible protein F [Methylobacterium gnaphalii]GLS47499.1 MATE family efflux transporter [Methylobacterium gnaphalii]
MQAALPPLTNRRMLALAVPATLASITTPLIGFVGATVIGRLGDAALLGAVALGGVVFDAIFWSFGCLRMATAGLTAQAIGACDSREIARTLARSLTAAALIGLTLVLAQVPIARLVALVSGASPDVLAGLATYFHIRIFAAPFTLANYAILGSVLGRGRTDLGLFIQVAINLTNIALTLVLVIGAGFGIAGAAVSALVSDAAGTALGLAIVHRLGTRPFAVGWADVLDAAALARTLKINADVLIRTLALVAAIVLFSAVGARFGDVTLAANAVLWNLFLIGGFFLDGFTVASEAACGQAVGARDRQAFAVAARLSLLWSLGFGIGVSLLFLVIGHAFIDTVTTNPAVRAAAYTYLPLAAAAPFFAALPFAMDGIFIGATWTRAMRDLMLAAVTAYLLALAGFQGLGWGNTGLWTAFLLFLAARGIGQGLLYSRLSRRTFPETA